MANETEFLFFFPSGLWTATMTRGVGVMVEPEIVSEALVQATILRDELEDAIIEQEAKTATTQESILRSSSDGTNETIMAATEPETETETTTKTTGEVERVTMRAVGVGVGGAVEKKERENSSGKEGSA